ncbi:type II toxin-antitoxin system RelE/ParE family toxin [Mucilaginibacter sp. OK098]|uniref:type II toxin-antitoxin system RelE/ParE family toxin n=1 Tax=Mucilaginibacter sp. OK098 TaxID=1855297 RepID=UPI00090F752D|nr:type II toxin-antitoxin system RelE/ParE family toxin [Mucilaginibacter sp. OK098]SHN28895.1 RelE toxin of RelE / RelB toxin-antitoxin system [Mucilaginibacter sp. OK098]
MIYRVKTTLDFDKEFKRISKKHKGIKSDLAKLIDDLEVNPTKGTDLGQNIYKIRMSISGTNKGKSGSARVITCVVVVKEIVYLSEIYLKNEYDTVDADIVIQRLKDSGLI